MKIAKQHAKVLGCALLFLGIVGLTLLVPAARTNSSEDSVATVSGAKTIAQILQKRTNFHTRTQARSAPRLVSVLIVAGHDDEYSGTSFKSLREVDLNRQLAEDVHAYFADEEGINAVLSSDSSGYNDIFETYFQRERGDIAAFISDAKRDFELKFSEEERAALEKNFHNPAPGDMALRLYGLNRWVNDADFDLVVHIHFNDYRGRGRNKVGTYEGFSIYTPGKELPNYELSRRLADSVFGELKKIRPVSTLPAEEEGVIEDHELIALGANESLEAGSVLVEYGYIYEEIFTNPDLRSVSFDNMAYATYAGIKKMMGEDPMPRALASVQTTKNKKTANNLEWQFQKAFAGLYPPAGKTLTDCPVTGYFGECSARVR